MKGAFAMCAQYKLLANEVKRFWRGPGECDWCGQKRRALFDYRAPSMLDYRLDRPDHQFCNQDCWRSFHS